MTLTSADILRLVLSVCIAALTVFICWAIFYFVAGAQKIYRLVKRVETGVTKVEEIIEITKDKLRDSSAYFVILGEIAKRALEFVKEKKEKKATGKKK